MKSILMTSSALLLISGLSAAQAQEDECPAAIDAFTRDYEEALAAFGSGEALSASEQADLFGLRTTAENQYRAGNQEMCAAAIDRARLMLETAIAPQAIQPRELEGMEVRNAADEYLGEIDGVTLDPSSGRIAYVLVEHGGFLGLGGSVTPVPWRAVTWAPGAEALLLDIDEERLENAPRNLEGEATAQERRAWLLSMHSYYGIEPYWQSGIGSMVGAAGTEAPEPGGVTTVMTSGGASEPAGEETSAVAVEPEVSGNGGTAAAQPSDSDAAGSTPADATASEEGGSTVVTVTPAQEGEAAGDSGIDAVMERIGQLESRIEELSQQGVGDDLRQAIGDLEARVQELAASDAGQQVQETVSDLEQRVQALAESAPGEELQAAVSQLQAQVQEMAQSAPGRDLSEAVARMESQIRQLARSEAATGAADGASADDGATLRATAGEAGDAQAESGAAAAGASDPSDESLQARAMGSGTQASGSAAEPTQASAGATGQSGGVARVIVISPEDVQVIEPGEAEQGDVAAAGGQGTAAGGQEAGQETAAATGGDGSGQDMAAARAGAEQAREPAASGAGDAEGSAQARASDAGEATAGAGQAEGGEATAALGAAQSEPAVPQSESDLPSGGAGGEAQAALAGQSGELDCETGITRLEEDLARAEEMGLTTDEAQSELTAAQAMLSRDSQALCRAALKRAQEELVAQGLEPQEN